MRAKKLYVVIVIALFTYGLLSFYFNSMNQFVDFAIPDESPQSHSTVAIMDLHILSAPLSSGTSIILPETILDPFTTTSILTLFLANVVIDRRSGDKPLKLKDIIINEILLNPGIHLRELQRSVGCAMGALQYHLKNLEGSEIVSVKVGNSKHFFVSGYSSDDRDLKLSALSRNPTIKAILAEVFTKGRVTQAELSRTISVDKSLISYYTGNLIDAGILTTVRVFGRERPLVLTEWAHNTIAGLSLV